MKMVLQSNTTRWVSAMSVAENFTRYSPVLGSLNVVEVVVHG